METDNTNINVPTKKDIESMERAFFEAAPNLTVQQQLPLIACIGIAKEQYNAAHPDDAP